MVLDAISRGVGYVGKIAKVTKISKVEVEMVLNDLAVQKLHSWMIIEHGYQ
jgi:hypothetical protein